MHIVFLKLINYKLSINFKSSVVNVASDGKTVFKLLGNSTPLVILSTRLSASITESFSCSLQNSMIP